MNVAYSINSPMEQIWQEWALLARHVEVVFIGMVARVERKYVTMEMPKIRMIIFVFARIYVGIWPVGSSHETNFYLLND